ncbi:MAG TPA: Hsp20/alpha crystallin family protein [candidate division Zixibacteria bacterium]|nr:Hsp20/alpha crystallin family protein [candidate division Zixibacteria bacterium]
MSAKWRRSRTNSKKLDILKVFSKVKNKNVVQRFRTKNSGAKLQTNSYRHRIQKVSAEKKCREPKHLVDVLERTDEIIVVADFAGFNREDLKVHVKGERLTVAAEASDRKYRKSLNLPKRVIPSTVRTTYKNGVLEIRLKKVEEKSMDKIAG